MMTTATQQAYDFGLLVTAATVPSELEGLIVGPEMARDMIETEQASHGN